MRPKIVDQRQIAIGHPSQKPIAGFCIGHDAERIDRFLPGGFLGQEFRFLTRLWIEFDQMGVRTDAGVYLPGLWVIRDTPNVILILHQSPRPTSLKPSFSR